jgi:MFS family permease
VRRYLLVLTLFALGNSSDALLLARAVEQMKADGISQATAAALLPLLWAWLHVAKSLSSPWGGALSDRRGRVRPVVSGWLLYALVYAGFALVSAWWAPWILFAVYGVYYGLVEGTERALVADLESDPARQGTAFGLYHFVIGIAALPSSALCGWLWQWADRLLYHGAGPVIAFGFGALLALIAAILLPWAMAPQKASKQPKVASLRAQE